MGRESLLRYGARPTLSVDGLRQLPGGRIAYRIKRLRGGRAKHRIVTPLEFLARLAALVPPPRYPLLRYHGVLGPRSPWRRDVVSTHTAVATLSPEPVTTAREERIPPAAAVVRSACEAGDRPARGEVLMLTPNILGMEHWGRLLGGLLYAATPRVDWATLLRRSFDVDVLACARCSGRLRVLGEVTDPAMIRLVLEALSLPAEAPRLARARDPTELFGDADMP